MDFSSKSNVLIRLFVWKTDKICITAKAVFKLFGQLFLRVS